MNGASQLSLHSSTAACLNKIFFVFFGPLRLGVNPSVLVMIVAMKKDMPLACPKELPYCQNKNGIITQVSSYDIVELVSHHKQEGFDKEAFGGDAVQGFGQIVNNARKSGFDALSVAVL